MGLMFTSFSEIGVNNVLRWGLMCTGISGGSGLSISEVGVKLYQFP